MLQCITKTWKGSQKVKWKWKLQKRTVVKLNKKK